VSASAGERLTFFLDIDDTLLDNDAVKIELDRRLRDLLGADGSDRFWRIYEEVRSEFSVVDIPTTLSRYASGSPDPDLRFGLAEVFFQFPFGDFVYPTSFHVIEHLRTIGNVAILSDGDSVYQPAKIARSGIGAAVGGYVMIFTHKEAHLEQITAALPADRFVFVDDKPTVLGRIASKMTQPFATIFVRQGKYAAALPPGDWDGASATIDSIAAIDSMSREDFLALPRPAIPAVAHS
jgi:FMN phosphatase YigB (HAD superfamily)